MEGSNIYAFNLGVGDGRGSSTTLFYPRRIGRSPHFDGEDGVQEGADNYDIDQPVATSILGAAKLTSKTADGWSIGVMEAITAREEATIQYDRASESHVVEPLTSYFVSRIQRDLNEGRTSLGVIITSVDRDLSGAVGEALFGASQQDAALMRGNLNSWARSGGIDFRHRFADDTYELETAVAGTRIHGSTEAILRAQEHPNRFYQRPDATHLNVDPTLTSLGGYYTKVVLSKIKGEHVIWALGNLTYSPGFESNDMGFSGQVDQHNQFIWAQIRENDPGKVLRQWQVNLNLWSSFTFAGLKEPTALGGNVNSGLTLLNYWQIHGGLMLNAPTLHVKALWGGPAMRQDPMYNGWYKIGSDDRKAVSFGLEGWHGGQWKSGVKWTGVGPNVTWRPNNYFSMRLAGFYNHMFDTWANWDDYGPTPDLQTGDQHYIMATLTRNTLSATLRFDLTLSPTLSIQFYGSPFVTAGAYTDDKLAITEQALDPDFDRRFATVTAEQRDFDGNPNTYDLDGDGIANVDMLDTWGIRDFNFKQFNSNLVVRWEYVTGSSIFLVWSRNMSEFLETGAFSAGEDLQDLFGLEGENVFLIKASYLFSI